VTTADVKIRMSFARPDAGTAAPGAYALYNYNEMYSAEGLLLEEWKNIMTCHSFHSGQTCNVGACGDAVASDYIVYCIATYENTFLASEWSEINTIEDSVFPTGLIPTYTYE
jgi:hypothetical protein